MGVGAMPAALMFSQILGPALAGVGVMLGIVGMFTAVLRARGTGFVLSLAGTAVCASVLFAALLLLPKGMLQLDRRQALAGTAKQDSGDARATGPRRPKAGSTGQEGFREGEVERDPGKPKPRATERESPHADPGPRPDAEESPGESKVSRLVRDLKSENRAARIRAAEELGKMKEQGKPAARALCETALNTDQELRLAALEALEKIHPSLYKSVATLLLDREQHNQAQAARAIKLMGQEGNAATPVLLSHLKASYTPRQEVNGRFFPGNVNEHLAVMDMAALQAVAADEPETVSLMIELATFEGQFGEGGQIRQAAIAALAELAKKQRDRRPAIVKALVAAAQFQSRVAGWQDQQTCIAAINALGAIGPDARQAIPELKKLKLSPDKSIREAASAAVEQIEK
jgi:HEAT repeat protein